MSIPFILVLCGCLGLFFKADWSKRADPFNFQSWSEATAVDGAVKPGRGLHGGQNEGYRIEREEKDLPFSYKVSTLLGSHLSSPIL